MKQISLKSSFLIFFVLSLFSSLNAQVLGTCGLTPEDGHLLIDRLEANRRSSDIDYRSEDLVYIPVKYHLVADKKGENYFDRMDRVFESLCKLNESYGEVGLSFYLKGIRQSILYDVKNDQVFTNPKLPLSARLLSSVTSRNKDAVNIYVVDKIGSDGNGGVVLGYYTGAGDYVVMAKTEISNRKSTLAHELGHFFTLPHPFFGWESNTYDPNKPTPQFIQYGNAQVRVEYVSQDKKANGTKICEISADRICDTRASYKLGFGYGQCEYKGNAKDPDGVLLEPTLQERNYMSYFLRCSNYSFTPQQGEAMIKDFNSSKRNYLRPNYQPLKEAPGEIVISEPTDESQLSYFDYVLLDWEDAENTQLYFVELARNKSFTKSYSSFYTEESQLELSDLNPNNKYYWRVTPFNETHFCERPSSTIQFRTGDWSTATKDIDGLLNWAIYKNPVLANESVSLIFNSDKILELDLSIIDLTGKQIVRQRIELNNQENRIDIQAALNPGTYIIHIRGDEGVSSKKLTVIK